MVKYSKLGEKYRGFSHLSGKWVAKNNFGQKFPIDNWEKWQAPKIYSQNQTMVKCSKLEEKYRALKIEWFKNTITFDLIRILTCHLKLWDDIAEILQYMNF